MSILPLNFGTAQEIVYIYPFQFWLNYNYRSNTSLVKVWLENQNEYKVIIFCHTGFNKSFEIIELCVILCSTIGHTCFFRSYSLK